MKLVACSLLLVVACKDDVGDYYTEPGGGGGGGFGTMTGAGGPDANTTDGGNLHSGRVCGLSEILDWADCEQGNPGLVGLLVEVGGEMATSMDDGAFEIAEPSGANLYWRVSGNAQLASLQEFPGEDSIPSISISAFQNLAADANVTLDNNVGTLFARVTYNNMPVEDATATLVGSADLVYYDDPNGSAKFSVGETRQAGMIWFPNVEPGATVTFTVTPPAAIGTPKTTVVTVESEAATFVTVAF